MSSKPQNTRVRALHPFGGCNQLLLDYKTIGFELLRFERDTQTLGLGFNSSPATEAFRVGISFIRNEVLDSYLEDLLDLEIDESKLFLRRGSLLLSPLQRAGALTLVFALIALFGFYAESYPIAASALGALTVLLGTQFFLPRSRIMRRMRFARIISLELSNRSGGNGTRTPLKIVELARQKISGSSTIVSNSSL